MRKDNLMFGVLGLVADLVATFDDATTAEYVVDLQNGDITPAT